MAFYPCQISINKTNKTSKECLLVFALRSASIVSFTTVREGEYAGLPFARGATNGLTSWNNEFVVKLREIIDFLVTLNPI